MSPTAAPGRPRRFRRWAAGCCVAYLGVLLAAWLALQWSEAWWPATLLMFAPRWVFAVPFVVLVPAAALTRSRVGGAAALAGLLLLVPVTGFNIPWQRLAGPTPGGRPLRVVTLNMHYTASDPGPLAAFVAATGADVVAVQEWKAADRWDRGGWHVHATPRLFLASRHPIRAAEQLGHHSTGEHGLVARYDLDTPAGVVHVFSLHAATNRRGITDTVRDTGNGPAEIRENSDLRRRQCAFVAARAAECRGPVVVLGDFNTPPESSIFPAVWGDFTDAFGAAGWGWGYTFYGSRTAVRIDHVLAGPGWRVARCRVGPHVGSPHRPVFAELTRSP